MGDLKQVTSSQTSVSLTAKWRFNEPSPVRQRHQLSHLTSQHPFQGLKVLSWLSPFLQSLALPFCPVHEPFLVYSLKLVTLGSSPVSSLSPLPLALLLPQPWEPLNLVGFDPFIHLSTLTPGLRLLLVRTAPILQTGGITKPWTPTWYLRVFVICLENLKENQLNLECIE